MEFTALETFPCEELKSSYVAGLSYTARPVNQAEGKEISARRAKLLELLPQWVKEGKVALGRVAPVVEGRG